MKKRKLFVTVLVVLLALLMIAPTLVLIINAIGANAVTESESELNALKKKQEQVSKDLEQAKSKINSLEYERQNALAKKKDLDKQVSLTQQQIQTTNQMINTYDRLIAEKEVELAAAEAAELEQRDKFARRVREMEENGESSYLAILFDALNFSDLLSRLDFINAISKADKQMVDDLQQAKIAVSNAKTELETFRVELKETRSNLEVLKTDQEKKAAEAAALLNQIEDNLATSESLYKDSLAEENKLQELILAKAKQMEEEAAAKNRPSVPSTGQFMWPTSATYISSRFGNRNHPVYHTTRFHNGVDVGAGAGDPILAADSGTVVTSALSSSYGNYVVINHGNGYHTLYAHMSQRLVSEGATVNKGDTIGKVGSTGVSTGNHLHFEIWDNGTRVDPLGYFNTSSFTFSATA